VTVLEGASPDSAARPLPRILVAEDDPELRRAVTRTLERDGFCVLAAEDGEQAAALLAAQPFDAVVSDVSMPKMSGIDLLRIARERDLEMPVLLMTGAPDVSSAIEAVRHGACEYIIKPFDSARLLQLVRRAVDLNQLAKAKREAMRELGSGRPEAGDRAGLEITLNRAIDTLWMAYQPIVDHRAKTIFGYEALLRSAEPALPNPGAVIEAAARLGRLQHVGRAVRASAPSPMSRTADDVLLFVNLHTKDLDDPSLLEPSSSLADIAARVVLEITERASLEGVADARAKVARLREMGFRIAIDDLGAGYAGLTSFAMLEPEFVKLDMTLVRDVHTSPVKQKLVRSMTALCRDMGIVVIAEGIESVAERDAVLGLGCELLQGYLIARPGPAFPEIKW
jgi:EAL domain-containing protein (putative c-di-GMP-specific phosphodiesterase class I)